MKNEKLQNFKKNEIFCIKELYVFSILLPTAEEKKVKEMVKCSYI